MASSSLDGAFYQITALAVERLSGLTTKALKVFDSSLRGGAADEAIQNPRRRLWIASLRSQ
jgi:hypothetical protein